MLSSSIRRPLVALALVAAIAAPLGAQEIRFSTEDDLVGRSRPADDLYTFAIALGVERGAYRFRLAESAFTDRRAGLRFDETYLDVGRILPLDSPWTVRIDAGAVHLGHGLFGQRTQNAVHRAIHDDPVTLRYEPASLHPRLAVEAARLALRRDGATVGPRFEVEAVAGVKSQAFGGFDLRWPAGRWLALDVVAGGRWTRAVYSPLRPHLVRLAAAAKLELVVVQRLVVAWSYNDFGSERQYVSLGWKVPFDRSARVRRQTLRPYFSSRE